MIIEAKRSQLRKASGTDLVALPNKGSSLPFYYMPVVRLKEFVHSILEPGSRVFINGNTGTGKTEGLHVIVNNWRLVLRILGINSAPKNAHLLHVNLSAVQGIDELFRRRSIRNGNTYDEMQPALATLKQALRLQEDPDNIAIWWLSELLRCLPEIQHGILGMIQNRIFDDQGKYIGDGSSLRIVCDSNFGASEHGDYVGLAQFDGALSARMTANLNWDYLPFKDELEILMCIVSHEIEDREAILYSMLAFCHEIRKTKIKKGDFASIPYPNMRSYLSFIRKLEKGIFEIEDLYRIVFYGSGTPNDQVKARAIALEQLSNLQNHSILS